MTFEQSFESPFKITFSFETIIKQMKKLSEENDFYDQKYRALLEQAKEFPELETEVDAQFLEEHGDFVKLLLSDLFSPLLTKNEIKAVSMPLANFIFNPTKRLEDILENAGHEFTLKYRGLTPDKLYILSCCVILSFHFNMPFKVDYPFIYDIPNKEGYLNHYRILSNADYIEIHPTKSANNLSQEDLALLLDNFEDIDLWKEKFPPQSWEMRGFGILNLYDATTEIAISNLKGILIQPNEDRSLIKSELETIFRSIFKLADLEIGYTAINLNESKLESTPINLVLESNLLSVPFLDITSKKIFNESIISLMSNGNYLSISDIQELDPSKPYSFISDHLKSTQIRSAIFTPIFKDEKLIGVLEITSSEKVLNSINAQKMDSVLPYIQESINQIYNNLENHIAAIIQQEYTSIHPSVYWKFHDEALRHVSFESQNELNSLPYKNISFNHLTPLYGQSDIKSSSLGRNQAIIQDLKYQLETVSQLLDSLEGKGDISIIKEQIQNKIKEVSLGLKADTESEMQQFFASIVHPILDLLKFLSLKNNEKITQYYNQLEPKTTLLYSSRKRFDESVSILNKELSTLLDKRQEEQQAKFPFYYERFKTDGIEHNIYIGSSIAPWLSYDSVYLRNLKLWQLRILAESEVKCKQISRKLPHFLEITSLILAYGTTLSIQFRMDEKRFDVDGTYNARYEVIKKRIDKALLKDSTERLVQVGKIAIVYAQQTEKEDYLNYISLLQKEGVLTSEIEIVDIEDLQGIIGLQAIRVGINYSNLTFDYSFNPEL